MAESLDLSNQAFSVVFVGTTGIRRLNKEWRKKDCVTDVLSFAYEGEIVDGVPFLGEIVIAPEIAIGKAIEYDGTPEHEIRKLIVHGTLHLMGYDHEADGGEMIKMQNQVTRRRFFKATPYIFGI